MELLPDEVITRRHAEFLPGLSRRRNPPRTEESAGPSTPQLPLPLTPFSLVESSVVQEISFHFAEERPVPKPRRINFMGDRRQRPRGGGHGPGGSRNFNKKRHFHNAPQHEPIPPETLSKMRIELDALAVDEKEKQAERAPNPSDNLYQAYLKKVSLKETLKIFSESDNGYIFIDEQRTEEELRKINEANFDILRFLFYNFDNNEMIVLNPMEVEMLDIVDAFILKHNSTAFRRGAFSVAIDFDESPLGFSWRDEGVSTKLFRPVVIDGVAVLHASSKESFRPFHHLPRNVNSTLDLPYNPLFNFPVKPLFDIIMGFLLRGHKTTAYLPRYYEKYKTLGGVCKVDDVFAFQKLIDLDFIKFRDVAGRHEKRWFNVMRHIVDEQEGVFVSSEDYWDRERDGICGYKKPSERVLTPCFLNTEDRLIVLEPTIRHRDKNYKIQVIKAEEILYYTTAASSTQESARLNSQLYLHDQIKLICELCELFPIKSWHKIAVKQLLTLVVRAESEFEMPGMTQSDFVKLREVLGEN